MLELRLIIPEKTGDAEPLAGELVELRLNRCRLPRCQRVLDSPHKEFCSDTHRSEHHNKFARVIEEAFERIALPPDPLNRNKATGKK